MALLIETVKYAQIFRESTNLVIDIPHKLFHNLKVRTVTHDGDFIDDARNGVFVLRVMRINSVKDLEEYRLGVVEKWKIKQTLKKTPEGIYFVVKHLHVA